MASFAHVCSIVVVTESGTETHPQRAFQSPISPLGLTLHIVTGGTALLTVAIMEIVIGLSLVSGVLLRLGLLVLAASMVDIMSPLVLFAADLFPGGTVTLEAQHVLKDIVLVAAGLVVAAHTLGARLVKPRS